MITATTVLMLILPRGLVSSTKVLIIKAFPVRQPVLLEGFLHDGPSFLIIPGIVSEPPFQHPDRRLVLGLLSVQRRFSRNRIFHSMSFKFSRVPQKCNLQARMAWCLSLACSFACSLSV